MIKLKRHKPTCIDQIPTEVIKAGVEQFALRSINLLILFGIRRNCIRSGRSRLLYLFTRRAIKQTVVIMETSLLSTTYKILANILLSRSTPYAEEIIRDN